MPQGQESNLGINGVLRCAISRPWEQQRGWEVGVGCSAGQAKALGLKLQA